MFMFLFLFLFFVFSLFLFLFFFFFFNDTATTEIYTLSLHDALPISVWKEPSNPSWPAWPNILRTSSSHEEGCERDWSITTKELVGEGECLKEGRFARVEWEKEKGGPMKMVEIPGSEFTLKLDLVLLAMGFLHVKHGKIIEELGVEYDPRGNIRCNPDYSTSAKGVFAAG